MKKSFDLKVVCCVIAMTMAPGPSGAFDTIASDFAFSNLQRKLLDQRLEQAPARGPITRQSRAVVSFAFDPKRTEANLRMFLERTPDPQAKADLQQLLQSQPGIIGEIASAMRTRYGLEPNNFADVYAAWWITAWNTAQNRAADPDVATVAAVRDQALFALIDAPDFLSLNDAKRQEIAEALLLQALLMSAAVEQAADDPGLLDQIAQAAARMALQNGIDLAALQLTPRGFELR